MSAIVRRGSLHLSREVYERYFAGVEGVALLRSGDDLMVLPVRHAPSGGYLLKLRNAAGDRVVSAADFFRSQGIDDDRELSLQTQWDAQVAGLRAPGVFAGIRSTADRIEHG